MKISLKNPMWRYVLYTNILFWFFVLGVCGVAVFVFEASDSTMRWLVSLCSWTPTMVLFFMKKTLFGEKGLKGFYKDLFKEKINLWLLLSSMLLIVGVFIVSSLILSIKDSISLDSILTFTPSLLLGNIFFTLIQGATGEESGWRGYMLPKVQNDYGFIKGNLVLGFVWAFWHLPLWFVSVSYTGISLPIYILFFIVGLVSFSMIMGVFMRKNNHILLACWLHFWFNFVLTFFMGKDIELLGVYAIIYAMIASLLVILNKKKLIQQT